MKKQDLIFLLLLPIFLVVLSFVNINNSKEFGSFAEEINEELKEVSELKSGWGKIENKNKITSKEFLPLNKKILTATEGMLKQYSEFAGSMSEWLKELSYIIIFVSFLNIYFISLVYRKYKNVNKNL